MVQGTWKRVQKFFKFIYRGVIAYNMGLMDKDMGIVETDMGIVDRYGYGKISNLYIGEI